MLHNDPVDTDGDDLERQLLSPSQHSPKKPLLTDLEDTIALIKYEKNRRKLNSGLMTAAMLLVGAAAGLGFSLVNDKKLAVRGDYESQFSSLEAVWRNQMIAIPKHYQWGRPGPNSCAYYNLSKEAMDYGHHCSSYIDSGRFYQWFQPCVSIMNEFCSIFSASETDAHRYNAALSFIILVPLALIVLASIWAILNFRKSYQYAALPQQLRDHVTQLGQRCGLVVTDDMEVDKVIDVLQQEANTRNYKRKCRDAFFMGAKESLVEISNGERAPIFQFFHHPQYYNGAQDIVVRIFEYADLMAPAKPTSQ